MQTERITFLGSPAFKANVAARAAKRGVSTSEFLRLAVDNMPEDEDAEKELIALVQELRNVIPQMEAALDRSCARLDATHRKVDALLRDAGIRS